MRIRKLPATCLVALCLCATVNAQGYLEPSKGKPVQFPTFGISLIPAEGWVRAYEVHAGDICRWAKIDAKSLRAEALVVAKFEPASSLALEAYVEGMRKQVDGIVEKEPGSLDRSPATVITTTTVPKDFGFRRGLIARHGDYFYTLSIFGAEDRDYASDLEQFRAGWKWTELESPAKHLELLPQPFPILNGLVTTRVPESMRFFSREKDGSVVLEIRDLTVHKVRLSMYMISLRVTANLGLDEFAGKYAQALADKLKLDKPPAWVDPKCQVECRMFESIHVDPAMFGAPDAERDIATRYVLVFPDPKTVVLLTFTMEDKDTEAGELYGALVEQIVQSIEKPVKKEAPPK